MIDEQAPPAVADSEMGPTRSGGLAFNRWLDVQLRARKLTQRQLAQKSGVDHSTISRLMRGDRTPSLHTAALLAHGLGMTDGLDWLDGKSLGRTAQRSHPRPRGNRGGHSRADRRSGFRSESAFDVPWTTAHREAWSIELTQLPRRVPEPPSGGAPARDRALQAHLRATGA